MSDRINNKWLKKLNDNPIPWLLESNPWTKYRTLVDLLEKPNTSVGVIKIKNELINDPMIRELIKDAGDWLSYIPGRNNDPKISYFKLKMLSEFGLTIKDPEIKDIAHKATEKIIDGMFAARGVEPKRNGKKNGNTQEWHIAPCNSPIITSSLIGIGLNNKKVKTALEKLKEKWSDKQGWFCYYFFVSSLFKKIQITCPMAGIMALEVFSRIPDLKESKYAKNAYGPIKFHKEYGKTMYFFGRSKKFWTFKYPFVWYNALYLADVLTRFKFVKKEPLLIELIKWIEDSQDELGRFKPTSMFLPYKNWDFGNKKEQSPWITFLSCRILKRYYSPI